MSVLDPSALMAEERSVGVVMPSAAIPQSLKDWLTVLSW